MTLMSREELATAAQAAATREAKRLPDGARIVVVVTDESGAWVGVGSNTTTGDVMGILDAARHGADFRYTPAVETTGEEAPHAG